MAAFSLEFAQESVANTQAENTEKKNTTLSQGLADAPRPTGQSPLAERAQTLGRETMTRFSNVMNNFKFTPRAAMMGGSCMAALIVSMVFYDAGQFGKAPGITTDSPSQVAVVEPLAVEPVIAEPTNPKAPVAPKAAASVDANIGQSSDIKAQISVKASKAAPSQPQDRIASLEGAIAEFEAPRVGGTQRPAPVTQSGGIGSSKGGRQEASRPPHILQNEEADTAVREYRALLQQKDNIQMFVSQQNIFLQSQKAEIRSLKRQLENVEKAKRAALATAKDKHTGGLILEEVPAEYKVETKTIVTKEATTEIVIPPATFETVTETVVVQPQSVEYVRVEPEYEWVEGDVPGNTVEYSPNLHNMKPLQNPLLFKRLQLNSLLFRPSLILTEQLPYLDKRRNALFRQSQSWKRAA